MNFLISEITEVDNLQVLYPLKDEWIISCSLETWLVDQMKSSTTEVEMVKRLPQSTRDWLNKH